MASAAAAASAPAQTSHAPAASAPHGVRAPVAASRAGPAADQAGWVSVWVVLDIPELASLPPDQHVEREALRLKILAQQDDVMSRLRALGATEQARVQQVRNALAVRLPSTQLGAARKLTGVRSISRVRDVDRGVDRG